MKYATLLKKTLAGVAVSIALIAGLAMSSAHAGSCPQDGARSCTYGALCFVDFWYDRKDNKDKCGRVHGTNPNWGFFSYNWNDKADYFFNNGASYEACVWRNDNYDGGWGWGGSRHIRRGDYTTYSNTVTSNSWTKGKKC